MKIVAFLITFLFTIVSFAQKLETEVHLKHTMRQENESYQFTVLSEDKKGVSHFDKKKYYYWFKAQKVIITQGGASGQLLNGSFEAFYDNKQLSRKGKFKKGLKDGEWLYWRENGSLIRTENWNNGNKRGIEVVYNEKGIVTETYKYKCCSFSKQTKDSLIVSNYSGSKKTITLFDKDGVEVSTTKIKNGTIVTPKTKEEKTEKEKSNSDKKTNSDNAKEKKNFFSFLKKK